MRQFKVLGVLLILAGVTGCAQVISGDSQEIAVQTLPKAGAQCTLQNGRGSWAMLSSPANVTLLRSGTSLSVFCRTDDGWMGSTTVEAKFGDLAYVDAIGIVGAAVDAQSGAAYEYPPLVTVSLTPPANTPRPMFGAEGGRGIAPPPDSEADRARIADDNIATRFQTLRVLLEDGLITREEYNTRRGANLGALLRYSVAPPARDLGRPAPPPQTLVARIRYLAGAYAEHSISAAEQAAERSVILNGLLPAPVLRHADPPPPITDQLGLAAEIGRVERMLTANVITEAEAAKEKAKLAQLLDASIAAADAAARMAAGVGPTEMAVVAKSTGIGVALSIHSSESQARRIWAGLQKTHPDELGALKLTLKRIPRPHRPSHYQIVAGPLPDNTAAINLCRVLRRRGLSCHETNFEE